MRICVVGMDPDGEGVALGVRVVGEHRHEQDGVLSGRDRVVEEPRFAVEVRVQIERQGLVVADVDTR